MTPVAVRTGTTVRSTWPYCLAMVKALNRSLVSLRPTTVVHVQRGVVVSERSAVGARQVPRYLV